MTGTSHAPLSRVDLSSVGDNENRDGSQSSDAKPKIRFGVAFRLLSALVTITAFAIAISVTALYTFGRYGDGFNRIASSSLPALVAADASALYARNLLSFLNLLLDPKTGQLNLNREDEIIAGSLVCIGGEVVKRP
jgi:hypothetical protein